MAVVTGIERLERQTFKLQPSQVSCGYAVFSPDDQHRILQLETGGSATRKYPGKTSQTLQFPEDAAYQLWKLIGREFGFDKSA